MLRAPTKASGSELGVNDWLKSESRTAGPGFGLDCSTLLLKWRWLMMKPGGNSKALRQTLTSHTTVLVLQFLAMVSLRIKLC